MRGARFTDLDFFEKALPADRKTNGHIDEELRHTLLLHFPGQLANVSTEQDAITVLEMAANHIHSATQQDFEDSSNLLLGGTLEASRGHTRALIVRAVDKSTLTPCVIKITAAAAINREAEVYRRLKDSNLNYVPNEKVTVQRRHTRTGETVDKSMCLKMPVFVCSLASVPKHVPEDLVLTRVSTDILPALRHMHTLGIYHMDVKLENILLDAQGRWCLSDFGSCASSAED
jgi:hypothetical protein